MKLSYALKLLAQAKAEHEMAVIAYGQTEERCGFKSEQANLADAAVGAASDKRGKAEAAVAAIPARTQGEALQKVVALLEEGMLPEILNALMEDAKRLTDPERDPIIPLARRWKVLRRTERAMEEDIIGGMEEPPEMAEIEELTDKLEERILAMTPTTPEGVAALADLQWELQGPGYIIGSEDWQQEIQQPQYVLMRRLRHSARLVAGIEPDR